MVYAIVPFAYAAGICYAAATALFAGSVYLLQPIITRLQSRNARSNATAATLEQSVCLHREESSHSFLNDEYGQKTSELPVQQYHPSRGAELFTDREKCSRLLSKIEAGIIRKS